MATLLAPADFRIRYPEFTALSDPTIQAALDDADEEINVDVWGVRGIKGESALAAHLLVTRGALNDPGATGMQGAGPINSMRVGDVTLSYAISGIGGNAVNKGEDLSLMSTKYGLEYMRLLKSLACGGSVT